MRSTDTSNVRMLERIIVHGAQGVSVLSQPNRLVTMILCSVQQGAVSVYFGSNPVLSAPPDLYFAITGLPWWVPVPAGQYEFTMVADDPTGVTKAVVILGGPRE
jgi:hypothetical protein